MTEQTLTLVARPGSDRVRLSVRIDGVRIDGSLWRLWPTFLSTIDTDSLTDSVDVGTVTLVDGTVDSWHIDSEHRTAKIIPQPPDEHCNGETAAGTLCQLTYNWGRDAPIATNYGRCKYHKDQPIETKSDPDSGSDDKTAAGYGETQYGQAGYGGSAETV